MPGLNTYSYFTGGRVSYPLFHYTPSIYIYRRVIDYPINMERNGNPSPPAAIVSKGNMTGAEHFLIFKNNSRNLDFIIRPDAEFGYVECLPVLYSIKHLFKRAAVPPLKIHGIAIGNGD